MKIQILRFSLHQNAKVMALMAGISSLLMFIPVLLIWKLTAPPGMPVPWGMLWFAPIFYLVAGYIWIIVAAWVYNLVASKVGGVEYFAAVTRVEAAPEQ